ncbi:MAG: BrnT family toxin [Chloroflexi bacterium]|nr:BrnT family toxin [Chloroflexota bacterium]
MKDLLRDVEGFTWDEANFDKNWYLHEVTNTECEEPFFNVPLILVADPKHSFNEKRYYALGHTDRNRWLSITFTIRNNLIRVISARDMNQKEMRKYETSLKRYPRFSE